MEGWVWFTGVLRRHAHSLRGSCGGLGLAYRRSPLTPSQPSRQLWGAGSSPQVFSADTLTDFKAAVEGWVWLTGVLCRHPHRLQGSCGGLGLAHKCSPQTPSQSSRQLWRAGPGPQAFSPDTLTDFKAAVEGWVWPTGFLHRHPHRLRGSCGGLGLAHRLSPQTPSQPSRQLWRAEPGQPSRPHQADDFNQSFNTEQSHTASTHAEPIACTHYGIFLFTLRPPHSCLKRITRTRECC